MRMRHTAARARAAGPSGSTRVHSSPFAPTAVRDSPADKRPRSKGSEETRERANMPEERTHRETDAGLASSRKRPITGTDGPGGAPPSPRNHPARASLSAGYPPKGPPSISSDARASSRSSGSRSRDDLTRRNSRAGAASASSDSRIASHTSGSKARGDPPAHYRERLASSSSDARAAPNSGGSKSRDERTEYPPEGLTSMSSDAHPSSYADVSKTRHDHTGHSRGGSASSPPGAHDPSHDSGSGSKELDDRTEISRAGLAPKSSDARTASNSSGSKLQDDRTGQSPRISSSTPSDSRTASPKSSNSKSREDRTRHSLGTSAPSSSDSRTAPDISGKPRGDHNVYTERGRRPAVPPPHSRAESGPAKAARGGSAAPSGQSDKSATAQEMETVSSVASFKVSSSSIGGSGCLHEVFQFQPSAKNPLCVSPIFPPMGGFTCRAADPEYRCWMSSPSKSSQRYLRRYPD